MPAKSIRISSNKRIVFMYVVAMIFMVTAVLFSLLYSSVKIPLDSVIHIILEKSLGLGWKAEIPINVEMIIWEIRLPRILLGLMVGAALSLAGAAFQGLLRNPLADPFIIGVSSGASLGAVLVLFFHWSFWGLGAFTLPVVAIMFGFLSLLLVFGMTMLSNRSLAVETIVLAGVVVSSFISAINSLIMALSEQEGLSQIIYWLMGSVRMRGWDHVQLFAPFAAIGVMILLMHVRELNALALGEREAGNLGVRVKQKKIYILIGASLLTGAAVAVSGAIGFVGLVIPHMVRFLTGPDHRHVLPLSMLLGGAYLVLADLLARTVIAPQELPIGVITALVGAPIFAVLLIRQRRR